MVMRSSTTVSLALAVLAGCGSLTSAMPAALDSYAFECHQCHRAAAALAASELETLRAVVEQGDCVPDLGARADSVCNAALEAFSTSAPDAGDDREKEELFDKEVEELERAVDTPLRLLYARQLTNLREKALRRYRDGSASASGSNKEAEADYQAMVDADAFFAREAEASTRQGADWDFAAERAALQGTMGELATRAKRMVDMQLKAAASQQKVIQLVQMYQQQLQQLQQQAYGQSSPLQFGWAYRVPDTSINLGGQYQNGKTSIQLQCVPDDSVAMLGPNGFTRGVGPGNLGLNVNMNL